MKHTLFALGFAATGTVAFAQHPGHGAHDEATKPPATEKAASAPKVGALPRNAEAPIKGYRSAFEDYRPFNAKEPTKGWRTANDEVREAGGHVGLMKGAHGGGDREGDRK